MTRQSTVVALLAICFAQFSVNSQPLDAAENNRSAVQSRCGDHPIGRILTQGDRHFKAGDLLCKGDRLDVEKGATVHVLCLLSGADLEFSGLDSDLASRCVGSSQAEVWGSCIESDRANCPSGTKGPGNNNTPVLISPYNSVLLDGRPLFSWYAFPGATSYTVEIRGEGVDWQKTVADTALAYPSEQPAMQPGNAYKITIIANNGNSPISSPYESAVNLISLAEARKILEITQILKNLKLPKDEEAFLDLDSIYMSKGLLTATITTLEARVRAGSQSPSIYRKLGDRYLEAGLPFRAESSYKTASILAKENDNLVELAKAKAGLLLIAKYRSRNPS